MKFFNLFIITNLISSATLFAEDNLSAKNSSVYLHTLRNTPAVSINNVQEIVKPNTCLPAKNIAITCKNNQKAAFIFPNRTVVCADENSKLEILDFSQTEFYTTNFDNDIEESASSTKIKLVSGKFCITTLRKTSESVFTIETPSGIFDIDSKKFAINIIDDKTFVYIFDGTIYLKNKGKHSIILRNGEKIIATKNVENVEISYYSIDDKESLDKNFQDCRFVFDTSFFDAKNDTLTAQRIIPKEVIIRKTK